MCIRDRSDVARAIEAVEKDADIEIDGRITVVDGKKAKMYMKNFGEFFKDQVEHASTIVVSRTQMMTCLLYTSDAADEEDSVDLGGRRIIKKKKKNTERVMASVQYTRRERRKEKN